jgi:hypothetical protein
MGEMCYIICGYFGIGKYTGVISGKFVSWHVALLQADRIPSVITYMRMAVDGSVVW